MKIQRFYYTPDYAKHYGLRGLGILQRLFVRLMRPVASTEQPVFSLQLL